MTPKERKIRSAWLQASRADCSLTIGYKGSLIHSGCYDGKTFFRAVAPDGKVLCYCMTQETAKRKIREYLKGKL